MTRAFARIVERASLAGRYDRPDVVSPHARSAVPHPRLCRLLESDAALGALLPSARIHVALGTPQHWPFQWLAPRLVSLPSTLVDDPTALFASARWALEAAAVRPSGEMPNQARLEALIRFGAHLLRGLPAASRATLLQRMPASARSALETAPGERATAGAVSWMAQRVAIESAIAGEPGGATELDLPLEHLLAAGGDSRLLLDASSGQNRYGVPPVPRPGAIQFSSSTASAISEYGFRFCDLLRRMLLAERCSDGGSLTALRARVAHAIGTTIAELLGLVTGECDVAIQASGTDAELTAVLVAWSATQRSLTNILIAPEESGRGIRLAGEGRYFDRVTAYGAAVDAGSPVFSEAAVSVTEVRMRDDEGLPLPCAEVDAAFLRAGREALAAGHHVLAHMVLSSKTGLSAPSLEAVDALVAAQPGSVDVVVDACQMRTPFAELGDLVRRGFMLQVSGSKFLTGPPFSGALVVPSAMRDRGRRFGELIASKPAVGHPSDWTAAWATTMQTSSDAPLSFGPIIRWLPALLEAELLNALPEGFRASVFDRFRHALVERTSRSRFLQPVANGGAGAIGADDGSLARLSILAFTVNGAQEDGTLTRLGADDCRALFEALNRDMSMQMPAQPALARGLAGQPAHIGQPVSLGSGPSQVTVLRMVLGARFFSIVGYADDDAVEAALLSEIADAERAISKLELLAQHWWRLSTRQSPGART